MVEGGGPESRCTALRYPGFESLPLRHTSFCRRFSPLKLSVADKRSLHYTNPEKFRDVFRLNKREFKQMKPLRAISILAITENRALSERLVQALHQILQGNDCTVGDLDSGPLILAHRPPDILFCDEAFANAATEFVLASLDDVPVVLVTRAGIAHAAPSLPVAAVVDGAALHPRDLEKAVRIALHFRQICCHTKLRNFQSMINRSPAVVFLWRPEKDWPVEFVSENVHQFGYDARDFVRKISLANVIHPDDIPRFEAEVARHLHQKTPAFFQEYRLRTANAEVRWVEDRTVAIFDNDGNISHYQGIVLDTTERRRALEALSRTQNVFETLVMTAPDAVLTLDSEAHIVFASPRTAELLKLASPAQLTGLDSLDFVAPEWRDRARAAFKKAGQEGAVRGVELLLQCADGSSLHAEFSATALTHVGGRTMFTAIARDISERIAAQEALNKTQEQFRYILDNSRDVAYKLNVQTWQYEYVSPSVSMFGINADDFIAQGPKAYRARLHPDDEAVMAALYEKYFQDPTLHPLPATIEYRVRNDAGEYRWIADTFRAIRDSQGNLVAEVGNIRDVTERKDSEALMLAQRDLALKLAGCSSLEEAVTLCLQTALVLAGMEAGGLYLLDEATRGFYLASAVNLSDEMVQEVAYATADSPRTQFLMKGQPVYCRYQDFALGHGEAAAREQLRALAIIPVLHQNTTIASLNLASRILDEIPLANRRALETIAAHIGTTLARLQAQEALRESEEKYRSLVENAYDGICIVQEGQLKYSNPQLAQILGAPLDQMIGAEFRRYFKSQSAYNLLQAALAPSHGPAPLIEAELGRRDGKSVDAEIKASRITFMNAPATLVLVRDVTDRNQALRSIEEQRLEIAAAARMSELGMMASGVAHEINNPLAVISGVAEQLRKLLDGADIATGQKQMAAQQIDKIIRHAHRIERIIANMKAFARDGTSDPVRTSCLATIIADALDLCEARFAAHGVRLEVPTVPKGLTLECRPAQIVQVLVNLLTNSFDAVEKMTEPWVKIDFTATPESIELGVVDSGPEMDPLVREQALQPFFSTKEIGKGSGLGLTISKGIVENHHGSLAIDHTGGHTRFVVRLPRKQPQNRPQGETHERP